MRLPIVTVNCTYQWGGDIRLIRDVAEEPVNGERPLVVLGVEARTKDNRPLPVRPILGDKGWRVVQDCSSAATAGSFFAVRRGHGLTVRRHWMFQLSDASVQGSAVQRRFQQNGIIDGPGKFILDVGVGHFPKKDTGRQDDAQRRMGQWWDRAMQRREASADRGVNRVVLWGGDPNMGAEELADRVEAPYWYGVSPMANVWSRGLLDVDTSSRREAHADHRVLTVSGRPR